MTNEQLEALNEQTDKVLAAWWCILNNSQWPVRLPASKVNNHDRRWKIMNWIAAKIGMKECLRMWNSETMSDKEFELWWTGRELPQRYKTL